MSDVTEGFSGDRVTVVRFGIGFLISMDKEMKPGVTIALSDGRIKAWFVSEVTDGFSGDRVTVVRLDTVFFLFPWTSK